MDSATLKFGIMCPRDCSFLGGRQIQLELYLIILILRVAYS